MILFCADKIREILGLYYKPNSKKSIIFALKKIIVSYLTLQMVQFI